MSFRSNVKPVHEFEFVHRRNGKRLPLWNYNRFGQWLFKNLPFRFCSRWLQGRSAFGFYADRLYIPNLVVDDGLAIGAARLVGSTSDPVNTLAVGTGTTAAAAGDTALEAEITDSGLGRATDASPTFETIAVTNDTAVLNYEWTASGSKAITECAALTEASGDELCARQVFAAVNVVSGDTFEATWKFQFTTS